jgi:hypothetical protein
MFHCQGPAEQRYIVREARRSRTVEIVKLDWLEDSLLTKGSKPLDTSPYRWEQRKVTKSGAGKRHREEGEGMEGEHEVNKLKLVKEAVKQPGPGPEDVGLSKEEKVDIAGKYLFSCHLTLILALLTMHRY